MWTENKLDGLLTAPSDRLTADISKIDGDIMILGAGGKMGPSLAVLAKNAALAAGTGKRIIAVSRFTDAKIGSYLKAGGVETISADLIDPAALNALPDVPNIIYMAGKKFGTDGLEHETWAMNAWLPSLVAEKYKASRIVAFSTGNVYPLVSVSSGGATEDTQPGPVGEYAMSCLGRERIFEHGSAAYGTPVLIYRLNYALDLRYGVLFDIASKVFAGEPVSLANAYFNCIWQGDANEIAIRALLRCGSPAVKLNVTGAETASVRDVAARFGRLFGRQPVFTGSESDKALLSDASKSTKLFGAPAAGLDTLIEWQAEWIMSGGRALGKPTHFEERNGKF